MTRKAWLTLALSPAVLTGPLVASASAAPTDDVFLSEYVEGSSFNKALEIENQTGSDVDLDPYSVEIYFNGSQTPGTTIDLSGTLADSDVYVIADDGAIPAILDVADLTSSANFFNGDDAVLLRRDAEVVDAFGTVGTDPGSEWPGGGANDTLQRRCETERDTDETDAFDASESWTSLPQDTVDDLGEPGCAENGGGEPPAPEPLEVFIHDVQGEGAESPLAGQLVSVSAVVTALLESDDALSGFFLQEEDADADDNLATSEGVFVHCDSGCPALAVGDQVAVTGEVEESFGMTQITTSSSEAIESLASGVPLPTASPVELPAPASTEAAATFENVEAMIIVFPDELVVSEYFQLPRFGQIVLTETARPYQFTHVSTPDVAGFADFLADLDTRRIILDDNTNDQNDAIVGPAADEPYPYPSAAWPSDGFSTSNPFRGGETVTDLVGVMDWAFSAWRIRPIDGQAYEFDDINPRTTAPEALSGDLRVASFNVLNYFTTLDLSAPVCGPSGDLDCRGAHSEAELERQRDKIVDALLAIDADVVGLIEIENNETAVQTLVDALNDEAGPGTYAQVDTGTIGTDAIKVGFIYQPAAVSLEGDFVVLDSSVDPRFVDDRNRPVLLQTFRENASDEVLTVAVNHLKSKGSSCDDIGDPDTGDGQGNCSGTRTAAAQALADYLATDPTGSGDPDALIIGDLNSYRNEDPIVALEDAAYTDLVRQELGDDAYSFVFDGQLGYLDHALANSTLIEQVVGATIWNINADEASVLDYNDDVQDPGEASFERKSAALPLFDPDPYRSSDHDPVVVDLDLGEPEPTLPCGDTDYTASELESAGFAVRVGTEGPDVLRGTSGPDALFGLGGADLLFPSGGDDLVCAGSGRDIVTATSGNNEVVGEDGPDLILTGPGEDVISGGPGTDQISAGDGDDVLDGGEGVDSGSAGAGDDTCVSMERAVGCTTREP